MNQHTKTIVLGDIHGRSNWKLALHQENQFDRVIFVGDYFDSFDITGVEQIHNGIYGRIFGNRRQHIKS